jgi:Flp pilus assembly protein TadD
MKLENPTTKEATQQSLAAFEEALAVDPGFVLAHVQHARMQIRIIQTFAGDDVALVHRYRAEALAELQHSVSLAPDFGVAHAILALALWESWNFVDAARELARAKELAPGDASVYRQYATFEVLLGNFGDAVAAVQRATELDPLSPGTYMTAAATLAWAGQPDAALVAIHHAQELGFNGTRVIDEIADTQLRKGNFQEAQRSCAAEADYFQHYCLAIADHRLGKQADAEAQLAKMQSAEGDNSAYLYAVVYASWGSADKALDWLEKAYSVHDDGLVGLRSDYLLAPLHGLARYQAVEREMKFPP